MIIPRHYCWEDLSNGLQPVFLPPAALLSASVRNPLVIGESKHLSILCGLGRSHKDGSADARLHGVTLLKAEEVTIMDTIVS